MNKKKAFTRNAQIWFAVTLVVQKQSWISVPNQLPCVKLQQKWGKDKTNANLAYVIHVPLILQTKKLLNVQMFSITPKFEKSFTNLKQSCSALLILIN